MHTKNSGPVLQVVTWDGNPFALLVCRLFAGEPYYGTWGLFPPVVVDHREMGSNPGKVLAGQKSLPLWLHGIEASVNLPVVDYFYTGGDDPEADAQHLPIFMAEVAQRMRQIQEELAAPFNVRFEDDEFRFPITLAEPNRDMGAFYEWREPVGPWRRVWEDRLFSTFDEWIEPSLH